MNTAHSTTGNCAETLIAILGVNSAHGVLLNTVIMSTKTGKYGMVSTGWLLALMSAVLMAVNAHVKMAQTGQKARVETPEQVKTDQYPL